MADRISRAAAIRAWNGGQGFGVKQTLSAKQVLNAHSWVRTLGGADPYLALFARGCTREREPIDEALRSGEVRVSPAVRGCMYLVPDTQVDLALSLAYHQSHKRNARDLEKAGGTTRQITKTAKAVSKALADQEATTVELRKRLTKSIVRFGEAGKKVGVSSSLPVALRQLEFDGVIERTPLEGRLDTETYRWSLRDSAATRYAPAEANRAIAQLFFDHHAPASFEHFVAWSGLTKGAAKAAVAELGLESVEVEDHEGEGVAMLATTGALDAAHAKTKPKGVALLGLQDLYLVVRGGPAWVCEQAFHDVTIPRWGSSGGGPIRTNTHPHLRTVIVKGELAGFWDVNAGLDAHHLAWLSPPNKTATREAEAQLRALRAFMATQLGHAKTYSIDSPKKIDARFELVRGL